MIYNVLQCPTKAPAYNNDPTEVNMSAKIKSIRWPRQSFLCALIGSSQASEDINNRRLLQ